MAKNYYDILGVDKSATKDEIKKAYKKRARETHPDRNPGKEDEFKEINEAYETLSDDKKRAEYDNPMGGFGDSFFEDMNPFGFWSGGRHVVSCGETSRASLSLSIEDIYDLKDKTVLYTYKKRCRDCEESCNITSCDACHGTGFVTNTFRHGFSIIQNKSVCHKCNGTGTTTKKHCDKCNDTGFKNEIGRFKFNTKYYKDYIYNSKEVDFNVGAFGGEGKDKNSERGSLIVNVKQDVDNSLWWINNGVLYGNLAVDVFKMIAGGDETFVLPNKKVLKISLKPYTQPGAKLSIPGYGLLCDGGKRGDLIVGIVPMFPRALTEKQINVIKENFLVD